MASQEELEAWDKELNDLFDKLIGQKPEGPGHYSSLPGVQEILSKEPVTREHADAIIAIIRNYVPLEKLELFHKGGDASKWGVSDFYEGHEKVLKAAIEHGTPFTTGWFSSKKEPQSGKITRHARNGPIEIMVSVCMDDGPDLVDTIIWEAAGKSAGSGYDFMKKFMKTEKAINRAIDKLLEILGAYELVYNENCIKEVLEVADDADFSDVVSTLDGMATELEATLDGRYQEAIEVAKEWLLEFPKARKLLRDLDRGVLDWSPDDDPKA